MAKKIHLDEKPFCLAGNLCIEGGGSRVSGQALEIVGKGYIHPFCLEIFCHKTGINPDEAQRNVYDKTGNKIDGRYSFNPVIIE